VRKEFNKKYEDELRQCVATTDPASRRAFAETAVLLQSWAMLRVLDNNDAVGTSTVSAISHEVLSREEELKMFRAAFGNRARVISYRTVVTDLMEKVETPEEMISAMRDANATVWSEAQKVLEKNVADEGLRNYLIEFEYIQALSGFLETYRDMVSSEVLGLQRKEDTAFAVLEELLRKLPSESPVKAHLAAELLDSRVIPNPE
jgi:hypothetical protein